MKCPICGNDKFVYIRDTGELVCKSCGYVIKVDNIDMRPEFREEEVKKSKVSESEKRKIKKIRKWMVRSQDGKDKNISRAYDILQRMCEELGIPDQIFQKAMEIYKVALKKDLVKGRTIKLITSASLYLALRTYQNPRPIKKISKYIGIRQRELNKAYKLLVKELGLKPPMINPASYVRYITSRMNLPGDVSILAERIVRLVKSKKIMAGKNPIGISATAVYCASLIKGYDISYIEIAKASDVGDITVLNTCKLMLEKLNCKDIKDLEDVLEEVGIMEST